MAGGTGRKETKKSSFYVWFLGSLESGGLRGEESVALAVRALVDKEKEEEPLKVTLQVSHKGIKIVQNFPKKVKHFIPVHAVTDVIQERKPDEDLVSCVLLLYNPATRCPVHVHTYRCDSGETAAYLRQEIASLVHRPEQQRRLVELEARLRNKGVLPPRKMLHSDGRSSSTSSGSSNPDSATLNRDRIASLYDSLAAELREKLNSVAPLLLPPRDYDTVHRSYGRLENIEERRSKTSQVVGTNGAYVPGKGSNSDGKSSGIGSEEPSDHQRPGFPSCSSDEEWERVENHVVADPGILPTWNPEHPRMRVTGGPSQPHDVAHRPVRRNQSLEDSYGRRRSTGRDGRVELHRTARDVSPTVHLPERYVPGSGSRKKRSPEGRQRCPSPQNDKDAPPPVSGRETFQELRERFLNMEREHRRKVRTDRHQGKSRSPRSQSQRPPANASLDDPISKRDKDFEFCSYRREADIPLSRSTERLLRDASPRRRTPMSADPPPVMIPETRRPLHHGKRWSYAPAQEWSHGSGRQRRSYAATPDSHRDANQDSKRKSYHELPHGDRDAEKRRSCQDLSTPGARIHPFLQDRELPPLPPPKYQELSESERYPGLDRDTARFHHHQSLLEIPGDPGEPVPFPDYLAHRDYRNSQFNRSKSFPENHPVHQIRRY